MMTLKLLQVQEALIATWKMCNGSCLSRDRYGNRAFAIAGGQLAEGSSCTPVKRLIPRDVRLLGMLEWDDG